MMKVFIATVCQSEKFIGNFNLQEKENYVPAGIQQCFGEVSFIPYDLLIGSTVETRKAVPSPLKMAPRPDLLGCKATQSCQIKL